MSFPCNPSFQFSNLFFFRPNVKSYIRISFMQLTQWIEYRNHSLINEFELHHFGFLWTTKLGIRDGQAIKLMANMTERNGLVLLLLVSCQPPPNAYIFNFLFFFFSLTLFCNVFVLFCSVFFSLIFQADTNSILFHLVVENLILHIFLIIIIIMPCSGMFRNVPGCSGMFHVPGLSTPFHYSG